MPSPMPTPSFEGAASTIDQGIRRALATSPALVEAIRGMLRHAIVAQAFEHGRAMRFERVTDLLKGVPVQDSYADEVAFVDELSKFASSTALQKSAPSVDEDRIRAIVAEEVSKALAALRIVKETA